MIFPEKGSLDFAFRGNLWKGEFPPKARSICFFACWTFKRLEDSLLSAAAMNQSLTVEPKRSVSYRYDREIAEVVLASMGKLLCTSLVNLSEQWVSAFLCLFFFFLPHEGVQLRWWEQTLSLLLQCVSRSALFLLVLCAHFVSWLIRERLAPSVSNERHQYWGILGFCMSVLSKITGCQELPWCLRHILCLLL